MRTFDAFAERPKPILSFIPNHRQSFVHYSKQENGGTHSQLSLRFQVSNLTDYNVKLSAVRLLRPKVKRAAVMAETLATRHPKQNMYSADYPILSHSLTYSSVNMIVNQPIGAPGRPLRVIIGLQDHRGRWHKVAFADLSAI